MWLSKPGGVAGSKDTEVAVCARVCEGVSLVCMCNDVCVHQYVAVDSVGRAWETDR